MKTMKAAVFEGNGILQYKDVPVPTIQREYDVLVQVEAASICGDAAAATEARKAFFMKSRRLFIYY